jgi:hypothetical protein
MAGRRATGDGAVMSPQITHIPCDLEQQQKRRDAKRWSVARAIERSRGKRSIWERLVRRTTVGRVIAPEDLRACDGEDVFHGLKF